MGLIHLGLYVLIINVILSFNCSVGLPAGGSNGRCRIRCGPSGSRPGNFNEDDLIDRANVRGGYGSSRHGSSSNTHGGATDHGHGQTNHGVMVTDRHGVPESTAPATRYTIDATSETFDLMQWFRRTNVAFHRGQRLEHEQTHRFITVIPHIGLPVWINLLWAWTDHPQVIRVEIFVANPDNIAGIYRRRVQRTLNTITIRTSMFSQSHHRSAADLLHPRPPNHVVGEQHQVLPNEFGILSPFSTWHYSILSNRQHGNLVGYLGDDYLHQLADGHGPLHEYFSSSDEENDEGHQAHGHHNNQQSHSQHGNHHAEAEPYYSIEVFHRTFSVEDILRGPSSVIMLRTEFIIEDEPTMGPN